VLEELIGSQTASKPHCVIAATHDGELGGMLESYDACHFTDTLGPEGLEFDYRLRPGVAKSRTAIALLRLHGAPATMIEKALKTATRLDNRAH
jgi:DNA mismatch repair ATPase MutS